jgi:hypothetical protein
MVQLKVLWYEHALCVETTGFVLQHHKQRCQINNHWGDQVEADPQLINIKYEDVTTALTVW